MNFNPQLKPLSRHQIDGQIALNPHSLPQSTEGNKF